MNAKLKSESRRENQDNPIFLPRSSFCHPSAPANPPAALSSVAALTKEDSAKSEALPVKVDRTESQSIAVMFGKGGQSGRRADLSRQSRFGDGGFRFIPPNFRPIRGDSCYFVPKK